MTRLQREADPDTLAWIALVLAPEDGTTVPDLMTVTRMNRPWSTSAYPSKAMYPKVSRGRSKPRLATHAQSSKSRGAAHRNWVAG
jgi:hypothetical protein